jgi:DNA-binding transcriptional regulator YiaG
MGRFMKIHNILETLTKDQEPLWVEIPYEFKTVLGTSQVRVLVSLNALKEDNSIVFKPYEEERLMKEQSKKYLKKVLSNDFEISAIELRFLMRLFDIKQSALAHALGVSEAAVSMQLSGENKISRQVQHSLALSFMLEACGTPVVTALSNLSKGEDDGYFEMIEQKIA